MVIEPLIFLLLDTPSPPHFHPTPTWFSTGRALDLCSGLTHYTAYTVFLVYEEHRCGMGRGGRTDEAGRQVLIEKLAEGL